MAKALPLPCVFPLPSWLRHCLCLVFPLPSGSDRNDWKLYVVDVATEHILLHLSRQGPSASRLIPDGGQLGLSKELDMFLALIVSQKIIASEWARTRQQNGAEMMLPGQNAADITSPTLGPAQAPPLDAEMGYLPAAVAVLSAHSPPKGSDEGWDTGAVSPWSSGAGADESGPHRPAKRANTQRVSHHYEDMNTHGGSSDSDSSSSDSGSSQNRIYSSSNSSSRSSTTADVDIKRDDHQMLRIGCVLNGERERHCLSLHFCCHSAKD